MTRGLRSNRRAIGPILSLSMTIATLLVIFIAGEIAFKAAKNDEANKLYIMTDLKEYCYVAQALPGALTVEYNRNVTPYTVHVGPQLKLDSRLGALQTRQTVLNAPSREATLKGPTTIYITNAGGECGFKTQLSETNFNFEAPVQNHGLDIVVVPKSKVNSLIALRLEGKNKSPVTRAQGDILLSIQPTMGSSAIVRYSAGMQEAGKDIAIQIGALGTPLSDAEVEALLVEPSTEYVEVYYPHAEQPQVLISILNAMYRYLKSEQKGPER